MVRDAEMWNSFNRELEEYESRAILMYMLLAGEFVLFYICIGHRYVPVVLL